MEPQYITKEYSIAVINHAIASAKFMEEKQSDIAELLGVDKSNIPNTNQVDKS
jgi:predicted XRE-type DNA-binding protein